MNIKSINLSATKSKVLILQDNGVPFLLPNLYLITVKSNLAEKSLQYYALVIKRAIEYYKLKGYNLGDLLLNGNFQTIFVTMPGFFDDYMANFDLNTNAFNNHIIFLKDYILWSLNRYLDKYYKNDEKLNRLQLNNIAKFESLFESFLLRNRTPNKYFKVIDLEKLDQIIQADLQLRYDNSSTGFRDSLILRLLFETGIRIGELLNLKTSDLVIEDSSTYIKIIDTEAVDSRKDKPRIKNIQSTRVIALSHELSELIKEYIINYRRKNYKAIGNKLTHPFLFTSKFGKPLSKSSINKLFRNINILIAAKNVSLPKLTPHKLRHTFAYNFLKYLIEVKGIDMERAKDELRVTCGWSPSSSMPQLYAGKYIWEKANSHNLERINLLYEENSKK